jgi:iron complex outermembrane receptor protein
MTRSRLCLALALVLAAPAALAGDPPVADPQDSRHQPKTLDTIQVTASPLPTSAEEMTQPAEILGGEKLDEAKGATLGETVEKLPGVQSTNFGAGVGRPVIRGMDGARVAVVSGGLGTQDVSTVSQDHGVSVEPFLADQIEVLKGPATLLYGSGAIGGVVNIVDGRIAESALDDTITGRAETSFDSVNSGWAGMGRVDAMTTDHFVLHADGVFRTQKDYDTPLGVQRNSFVESRTGSLGASYVADDGFAGIAVSRFTNHYGNPGEPGDAETGEPGVSLDMQQDRVEAKAGINRDFGIFTGARASVAGTQYAHTEFEGNEVGTRFSNDATEARLELTHRAFGAWTGAFGLQGVDRTFEAIGEEAFVPRTRTKSAGVFVMEQGKWDRLQLELGARVDRITTAPANGAERSFHPVSLSSGAGWNFNDAWRVSLNLDRAERAPAEEELFANGPHVATDSFEVGNAELRRERATNAELGLHYHGTRIDAKASAYKTRFDGFIYLAETGAIEEDLPVRQWSQADARFRGVEAEVTAHLFEAGPHALDLRLFGDRVRATLADGGNLPRIAPARVGADLSWDNGPLHASLGAVRYLRQDDVAPGETPTAGYTLVDAHLAWHWDQGGRAWEVFVDGHNLTDSDARVHTSFLKDSVVLPGRGAVFGIRTFF